MDSRKEVETVTEMDLVERSISPCFEWMVIQNVAAVNRDNPQL